MKGNFVSRKRRVFQVYGSVGNQFLKLFQWDETSDSFQKGEYETYLDYLSDKFEVSDKQIKENIKQCTDFIKTLKRDGINKQRPIREKLIKFLKEHKNMKENDHRS